MKKIPVYNMEGKIVSEEAVSEEVCAAPLNKAVIYYYVKAYLTNQRQGNASTKTRSEVSGGGKKPWRQKGTGRARVGSNRNPLWRHGGVVFGPKPKTYLHRLPQKVKRRALQEVLRDKLKEERLVIFMQENTGEPKTKAVADFIKKIGFGSEKTLFILDKSREDNKNFIKSIMNLNLTEYDFSDQLNAYEILKSDRLVVESGTFNMLKKYLGEENGS